MADADKSTVDDLLAGLVAEQLAGHEAKLQDLLDAHPDRADEIAARYRDLEKLSMLWREGPAGAAPGGLVAGTRIGDYQIEREIGRGGMGVVYLARQTDLGRRVALKVIPPATLSAITRQRFLREARALASLSHPNIVPVFTAGEQAGSLFIAMEYVPGVPLSGLITAVRGRLPGQKASQAWQACLEAGGPPAQPPSNDAVGEGTSQTAWMDAAYLRECLAVTKQIAAALSQAHANGVIHRDVKPGNILIAPDGRARLLDFGLAAVHTEPHVTISGEFFGTPYYVAPEQAAGRADQVGPASDLYSLGATLYECLTLHPPFEGESVPVVLASVMNAEPKPARQWNPGLPRDVETILAKAMAKRPDDRYAAVQDFADDLERFLSGRPVLARRTTWPQRAVKWARRRPVVASLLALVVTMLLAAAGVWSWQLRQTRRAREQAGQAETVARQAETVARQAQADRGDAAAAAERWRYARLMAEADQQWRAGDVAAVKRLLLEAPQAWRGWEWRLLDWRCRTERLSLPRDGGAATSLAWRADGKALAVVSLFGNVQVWDLPAGNLARTFFPAPGHSGGVAWLAGGTQLASACADGVVRVWDAATGRGLRSFPAASPDASRTGWTICDLAVSADERFALTVGGDLNARGWVRLHDLATGRLVKSFSGHGSVIDAVAFAPDPGAPGHFATAGRDGLALLWDPAQDKPIREMRGHGAGMRFVYDVAFSPNSRALATSGEGGLVQLWDVKTGQIARTLRSTGSDVRAIAFSPGRGAPGLLAGVADDGAATVWQVDTGNVLTVFRGHGPVALSVSFSPDSTSLATGGQRSVKIWDLDTRQEGVAFGRPASSLAFTHDGARLVAGSVEGGGLGIWSANGGKPLANLGEAGDRITDVACHPKDARLVAAVSIDGRIDLWDLGAGRRRWTVPSGRDENTARRGLAFSPDGQCLAVGRFRLGTVGARHPAVVQIYNAQSGTLMEDRIFADSDNIVSVAFSPDGRFLAAAAPYLYRAGGQTPGGVALWRWPDRIPLPTLDGQDGGLYSFAFSPDGQQVAVGNNSGVIRVRDVRQGRPASALHGHKGCVNALSFSPDGRRLVSAGDTVMLWDLFTAQPVMTLEDGAGGYDRRFLTVAFSPDGRAIVVGARDRPMRIWSVPR